MSQSGFECNISHAMDTDWQIPADATVTACEPDILVASRPPSRAATRRRDTTAVACPAWKRAIDIAGSVLGLVVLAPVFLAVALLIKCSSSGPVFFRQRRFGARGRPFMVWKFRTIEINDASARHRSHVADLMDSNRPLAKRDYELAIIPGCRLLRRLGIDELPQLFNVLKGEMSLVGPRPDVVPLRNYQEWQRRRFDVVPGITGLWQVCGKNHTTFATMMRMDILYVRRRSFRLDMMILLRTIPAIVWS
jgi:lipopolysaccharide/colanic/teichoic acid biosynthesis glycosyltransferase